MRSQASERSLKIHLAFLYALAAVVVFACLATTRSSLQSWIPLAVLASMALVAEFLPVQLNRDGLRITLSLPFVAGIAISNGVMAAVAADLAISAAAAVGLARFRNQPVAWKWLSCNLAICAIAAGGAGLAMQSLFFLQGHGAPVLRDLLFVCVYCIINFLLVTKLNTIVSGRPFAENVLQGLRVGVVGLGLYCLVALAVAVLVNEGQAVWTPLMLVPVLALRAGLVMKARQYENYYETIAALSLMLQRANPLTHRHLERVAEMAEVVAIRLGVPPRRARLVRAAALLHDIGKIGVDEAILDKPASLTPEEMDHVRQHCDYGAEILGQCEQFRPLVPWVRCHHERPDGSGYPQRLMDVEIPLESKIIAVTDAFDAMVGTEDGGRSYREPKTVDEALAELKRCAGTQFDPRVVAAFDEVVRTSGAAA